MLPTVPVQPIRLEEYRGPAGDAAVDRLREAAEPLRGSRILHLNSTAFGGGVAELLFTHVALMQDLGIDATWQVLEGSDDFFAVTKFVHNGMQGADVPWTDDMARIYFDRVRANAEEIADDYDYVFVHDPQPAAVLRFKEEAGKRSGGWVWRCHIDCSAPDPDIWAFFCDLVHDYDAAVFTAEEYAQPSLSGPRIAFIPPSIDPLSTKNAPLDDETVNEVLHRYGVDRSRPVVTQVSRFDPWKDPIGVIDAFRLAREEHPELQLVMVGSMAHDDPEGWHYLQATEDHREGDPDIHLLTNFQEVGNLEVNAFQRASTVVLQKSIREGFGLTVSEAMWKARPVIGGNVGGIKLQIEDGVSGFLVDSAEECAERIGKLLADADLRESVSAAGRARVHERFLTLRQLDDYLRLLNSL
ncbi:MAG: glycosyltransferase [Actinomycetota bacterium]